MARFPADAPLRKVIKALESLEFRLVREGNHIAIRPAVAPLTAHSAGPASTASFYKDRL